MNGRPIERHSLSLASIPLVHLGNGIDSSALLAREVARGQWRVVEGCIAERNGVLDLHMCANTGGKRQKGDGFGEHLDSEKECGKIGYLLVKVARPAER